MRCFEFVSPFVKSLLVAVVALTGFTSSAVAAPPEIEAAVARGAEFLAKNQGADGSFSPQTGPAVTALVATGLLRSGRTADDPVVAKALKFLEKFVRTDGGIYNVESNHVNYETCITIMAFSAANADGRYTNLIKGAEAYVKSLQWDESEGKDKSAPEFGGAGYGKSKRPDLSNTVFFLDALKAAGATSEDPAVQKALVFVSRCQNLETEHNTTEFSAKNPDGGFYYTPAAGGSSQAGQTEQGGLRSYASMTYAGLKSMIFAGLGPNDPRVKAATDWLKKNYTFEENPGMSFSGPNMSQAGLFYYYHTMAKALDAVGGDTFVDASGKSHAWREELAKAVVDRQNADGSWTNKQPRWMEGDPNLVTGYALLTLAQLRPAK
jgi:squalene-hopene/tetraprenyl-beta-curcumene cyclase